MSSCLLCPVFVHLHKLFGQLHQCIQRFFYYVSLMQLRWSKPLHFRYQENLKVHSIRVMAVIEKMLHRLDDPRRAALVCDGRTFTHWPYLAKTEVTSYVARIPFPFFVIDSGRLRQEALRLRREGGDAGVHGRKLHPRYTTLARRIVSNLILL